MNYIFNFPDIGEGITEGVIVEWRVETGQSVKTGDPLVEMETDKVVTDIPSPKDGKVVKLYGKEGDTIEVDSPLVELEIAGSAPAAESTQGATQPAPKDAEEAAEEHFGVVGSSESAGADDVLPSSSEGTEKRPQKESSAKRTKVKATPVARNYAKQLGVDIQAVDGTGPQNRVMKADIKAYADHSEPTAAEHTPEHVQAPPQKTESLITEVPLTSIRKTIAKNMLQSKQSTAHMSLFEEVEISELVALRQRYKQKFSDRGLQLTYLPFFLKAATRALSEHPSINSEMDLENNRLLYKNYYHIGIAVDTEDGLVVPVIRDVDKKEISQLAEEIQEKARRARERRLTLDELKDASFTVTSYGSIGGLWGTAVINYPQAGILGLGRIHQQPVVKNGEIVVGTVLPVSLTVDHRIVDGGTSSRFVNSFLAYVKNPADMFIR